MFINRNREIRSDLSSLEDFNPNKNINKSLGIKLKLKVKKKEFSPDKTEQNEKTFENVEKTEKFEQNEEIINSGISILNSINIDNVLEYMKSGEPKIIENFDKLLSKLLIDIFNQLINLLTYYLFIHNKSFIIYFSL